MFLAISLPELPAFVHCKSKRFFNIESSTTSILLDHHYEESFWAPKSSEVQQSTLLTYWTETKSIDVDK